MEEGQEVGGAFSEGESTDGEMLMAGWEEEPPPPGGEVSTAVINAMSMPCNHTSVPFSNGFSIPHSILQMHSYQL